MSRRTLVPALLVGLSVAASSVAQAAEPTEYCYVAQKRGPIQVDAPVQAGWTDYGGAYAPVDATLVGRTVYLRGLAKSTSSTAKTVAKVPSANTAPRAQMIFGTSANGNARVDVHDGGSVSWTAGTQGGWVSLSGMSYPVGTGQPLALGSGYSAYGGKFRAPMRYRETDVVQLTGLVRGPAKAQSHIAAIPASWAPPGRRIFLANDHDRFTRLDVFPNGAVVTMTDAAHGWVPLDSVAYSLDPANPIDMTAYNWTAYGGDYAPPSINQSAGVVFLSGLAKRAGAPAHLELFTLHVGVRPAKQEIFWVLGANGPVRLDVMPSGVVKLASDPGVWVSLDGVSFLRSGATIATGVAFPSGSAIDDWQPDTAPDPAFTKLAQWECKAVGGRWTSGSTN